MFVKRIKMSSNHNLTKEIEPFAVQTDSSKRINEFSRSIPLADGSGNCNQQQEPLTLNLLDNIMQESEDEEQPSQDKADLQPSKDYKEFAEIEMPNGFKFRMGSCLIPSHELMQVCLNAYFVLSNDKPIKKVPGGVG